MKSNRIRTAVELFAAVFLAAGCGDAFTADLFPDDGDGGGAATTTAAGASSAGGAAAGAGGGDTGGGGSGPDCEPGCGEGVCVDGECLPSGIGRGAPCASSAQCTSGSCADGVCCNVACGGACESCRGVDTCGVDGTCSAVISGTDPAGECSAGASCYAGECEAGTIAFVTSSTHTGNLGGIAGADAICQARADSQCLPGDFFAWLSTANLSPSSRFSHQAAAYRLVDGTRIATGWASLTDGYLDAPIDLDEAGNPAPSSAIFCGASGVYTGTLPDGTAAPAANRCEDWTSEAAEGWWGGHTAADALWTHSCMSGGGQECDGTAPIYCFQQ